MALPRLLKSTNKAGRTLHPKNGAQGTCYPWETNFGEISWTLEATLLTLPPKRVQILCKG